MDLQIEKLAARKKRQTTEERKQKDLDLWSTWNGGGRSPDDLKPLFTQFRGMLRSKSNEWTGRVEIPPVAIQAEFNKQFVTALKSFDPNKGLLSSWVGTNLRKSNRWLQKHQNIARIVETRAGKKVGQFNDARAHLDEALGREPTHIEIAENLGWSPKEVATLQTELRKSHVASGFEIDPLDIMPSREKEALHNVYYDLSPHEQLVYDYTLGVHGKPELRPMQIAQKLRYSPSKVSRLRNGIMKKLKGHL